MTEKNITEAGFKFHEAMNEVKVYRKKNFTLLFETDTHRVTLMKKDNPDDNLITRVYSDIIKNKEALQGLLNKEMYGNT